MPEEYLSLHIPFFFFYILEPNLSFVDIFSSNGILMSGFVYFSEMKINVLNFSLY